MVLVETVSRDDVVVRRLEERQRRGDSISDAGVAIYRHQQARQEANPPGVPEGVAYVRVDTSPDGPISLDDALEALVVAGMIVPGIRRDGDL